MIDRFDMKTHREMRDLSGYEMVLGKSGLRMKVAEPPASDLSDIPVGKLPLIKDRDGELQLPFGRKALLVIRLSDGRFRQSGRMRSMADIAEMCSRETGRPVLDSTGLGGAYDFNVDFARVLDDPSDARANDAPDDTVPPFVSAFQSQLGLRLISKKIPVNLVIIDQIRSTPTEN